MLVNVMTNGHVIVRGLTWEHLGFALLMLGLWSIALQLPYWKPKGPKVECQATIKSKRMEYSNTPQMYYRGNRWNFLILFVDENGKEVELFTGEPNYDKFKEGDTGKLTYQGDKILEFETE